MIVLGGVRIMSRVLRSTMLLIFLLALLTSFHTAYSCTIAVISGSITPDGRPLLWKNRDINNSNYDTQEVRYYDNGQHGGYLCLVTTGRHDEITSYFGINDAGFAIMNSLSPDLATGSPSKNGIFMKLALQQCGNVDDFQNLLDSTTGFRGHIWANFGVIDGLGNAAMFETDDTDYRRYDADGPGQNGVVIRANNSVWGGGELGSRYDRATLLIDAAVANNELDYRHLIQSIAKNLGETPSMPCGQWATVEPAINRYTTRSSVVVHGVMTGEDPRLSTFWCTLGEPGCGVSIPLWSSSGQPSNLIYNSGEEALFCSAIKEKELYCYSSLTNDSTIDTEALVGTDGQGGIQAYSLPIENDSFDTVEMRLSSWRNSTPDNLQMNQFQNEIIDRSFHYYQQETVPVITAIDPISNVQISPGHEKVTLSWTDSPVENTSVEIWRARWNDESGNSVYPQYQIQPDNVYPTRPTDRAAAQTQNQWEYLDVVSSGTESYNDLISDRGVYLYELFAIDASYNTSGVLIEPISATNYWLGDVSDGVYGQADGLVNVMDMSQLGATFGLDSSAPDFLEQCDIGPTVNWSSFGIPVPDGRVDFEDLMIFSMNMGMTSATKNSQPSTETVALSWHQRDDGQWTLQLPVDCSSLKGLRLKSSQYIFINESEIVGSLIKNQKAPVFVRNIPANGFDLSIAVMDNSIGFFGRGELLQLPMELIPNAVTVEARDLNNNILVVDLTGAQNPENSEYLPDAFSLAGNFPNPFNPQTVIKYSLPVETDVVLEISSLSGRKVATLVSGPQTAGTHSVLWNGCDHQGLPVASGVYFYQVKAGNEQRNGRMCLVR